MPSAPTRPNRPPSDDRACGVALALAAASWPIGFLILSYISNYPLVAPVQHVCGLVGLTAPLAGSIVAGVYGRSARSIIGGTLIGLMIFFTLNFMDPFGKVGGTPLIPIPAFLGPAILCPIFGFFGLGTCTIACPLALVLHRALGPRGWLGVVPQPAPSPPGQEICFNCGYSLAGLPFQTPCPECGQPHQPRPTT